LLAALGDEERSGFLALAHPHRYGRNEVICHEGDPADSLHLLESGHLAVRASLPSGAAATFNILGSGDYFGELALLRSEHRRTATVDDHDDQRGRRVSIPLGQAQLADLVGATRPSVNQVLRRLVDQHLVELGRGHIDLLDVAALARRIPT
jgi:CRP/FNR family transcriptional regulator, cyclic AMP receptor protein